MGLTRRLAEATGLAAGALGVVATAAPDTGVGRLARRIARDVRSSGSSLPGMVYRITGRRPDPAVSDDVLADRIRSSLGPLEKDLDVPRVHVMVEDHVAIVHGDVGDKGDAAAIEGAIMRISGVTGVESHLHAGLIGGDTRPSRGAAVPATPSSAMRELVEAAGTRAPGPTHAPPFTRCCAASWIACPKTNARTYTPICRRTFERSRDPSAGSGERPRLRTLPQLVAAVTAEGGIEPRHAEAITRSVVGALRGVVPEEARDIAAVLPGELRELWTSAPAH